MLTQAEFEEFINDTTKQIDGNILWIEDEDHSPAVEFRVELIPQILTIPFSSKVVITP